MKIELTPRDVVLLKVTLTALVAVVMLRFLIFPAIEHYQELCDMRTEAEQKQEEMQYRIDQIPSKTTMLAKQTSDLLALSESYYPLLKQSKIDEIVTGLAYQYQLFPSRLQIGEYTAGALLPYRYSILGEELAKKQENGEQSGEPSEEEAYIWTVSASITLIGDEKQTLALIDDIEKNYPSILIHSFSCSKETYLDGSYSPIDETTTSLDLTLVMCEKPEEKQ